MGLGQDAKNLILGNDGSDKEPVDFKTELQNAIKEGLINKADGTLLITARANCDKLGDLISRTEEKEIVKASKENSREFNSLEEELEYNKEKEKKKEEKEKKRLKEVQQNSLEEQIKASQNANKAKIKSEENLEKQKEIERK